MATFPGGSHKHQGPSRGPAHSKQVLVSQLEGGQGLSLQHGVEVHVAVGARAQEEIPGEAEDKSSMRVAGVRAAGPQIQAAYL